MDRAVIYLKGGASFELVAEEISVRKHNNEVTKLGWTKPRGDDPAYIDLSEIAAIVWGEAPEDAA